MLPLISFVLLFGIGILMVGDEGGPVARAWMRQRSSGVKEFESAEDL